MTIQAQHGDTVSIHYTGKLSDGTLFGSTKDQSPFEFSIGATNVIPGIRSGVIGMTVGEQKTITVPPEEAFGPHDPQKRLTVESAKIPKGVGVGDVLTDAEDRHWRILEVNGDKAVIDANHQLAGETIVFDVEMISIG
ncbi:MAG: peptidylprolyl isomerase [Leptospirillia bacterium]